MPDVGHPFKLLQPWTPDQRRGRPILVANSARLHG
jgi:hypothetical protein